MATFTFGPSGVYGFLGFGLGPNSGYLIPAFGSGGYLFFPASNPKFQSGYTDTGSGFGPLLSTAWNGVCGAASFANGLAFEYSLSGSSGSFLLSGIPLPSGKTTIIRASIPMGASAYFLDSSGGVSAVRAAGVTGLTGAGIPLGIVPHYLGPAISGVSAYFALGSGGMAVYTLNATPTATVIAPPTGFTSVLCCCLSTGGVPYAGVASNAAFAKNAIAAAHSLGNPQLLATVAQTYSGGTLQVWSGTTGLVGPSFSLIQQATGQGFSSAVAVNWQSLTGMFVLDSGSGILSPYGFSVGTITPGATVSGVTGTYPSVATYNNVSALVPQRSTSGILIFTLSGTSWVNSGSGNISGVTGIGVGPLAISSGTLAVAYTSGVMFATPDASGVWHKIADIPTSATLTALSVEDQSGNFFGAGSGVAYLFSSTGVPSVLFANTTTIPGSPVAVDANNLQYIIATSSRLATHDFYITGSDVNILSLPTSTAWTLNQGSGVFQSVNANFLNLGMFYYNGTIICPTLQGIAEYKFTAPYTINNILAGGISLYSGGAWSAVSSLPQTSLPNTACLDASGNVRFACLDGSSFSILSGVAAVSAQTVWSQGGGLVGMASAGDGSGSIYGAAAMAPGVTRWT